MDPNRRKLPPSSALIPLTLGLGAAIAVFSLFRGSVTPPGLTPALAIDPIPGASWRMHWSAAMHTPAALQLEGLAQLLGVLAALALVVLGAACVNTAIALLSDAASRRYEIALQAMLGASPRRLMRDFIADGLVLACLGGVAGTCIGLAAAAALHRTWPSPTRGGIPLIQPLVLIAVLLLPLAGSFLFSLAPRLRTSRKGWIGDALSPEARTNPGLGASDTRNLLVVVQFGLALMLFVSAGALLRASQPLRMTTSTPVRLDGLYTAEIDASHIEDDNARTAAYVSLLHHMSGSPEFQAESISSRGTLLGIGTLERISVMCGRCSFAYMLMPMVMMNAQHHVIAPGYFDTLGIRLLEGREPDGAHDDEVVINATLARMGFQDDGPIIGKQIQVGGFTGHWYKVVGIVDDLPAVGLHSQTERPTGLTSHGAQDRFPAIYLPGLAHPPATAELVFRTTGTAHDHNDVASLIAVSGLRVTSVASARSRIEHAIAPLLWFSRAFAFVSIVVLFLALEGLFTLMRTNMEARRTEIGLRRAVGARRSTVMLMVLREASALVAVGAVIGALVAPNIAQIVKVYFPAVHIFDATLTLGGIGVLAIAAFLGALAPALSAAWQDPAHALQHE